jgi:hypothetical protein
MINKIALLCTLALLSTSPAFAQHTKTGPHGTTATGSASRSGNTVSGNGSITGARGNHGFRTRQRFSHTYRDVRVGHRYGPQGRSHSCERDHVQQWEWNDNRDRSRHWAPRQIEVGINDGSQLETRRTLRSL